MSFEGALLKVTWHVFIPYPAEDIGGVYASLEDARKEYPNCQVDEYIVGHSTRVRSYDGTGQVWWENDAVVPEYYKRLATQSSAPDLPEATKTSVNIGDWND